MISIQRRYPTLALIAHGQANAHCAVIDAQEPTALGQFFGDGGLFDVSQSLATLTGVNGLGLFSHGANRHAFDVRLTHLDQRFKANVPDGFVRLILAVATND